VFASARYYPSICLERPENTTKASIRRASVPTGFRTKYLLNVGLDRYCNPVCSGSIDRNLRGLTNSIFHQNAFRSYCHHSVTGLKQAKRLIQGPSARKRQDMLKLNSEQSEMTHFQTGTDRWPQFRKVPRKRRISNTYSTWLWSHSLFKISSSGPNFYEATWLLWRPHKQSPTFHSKYRIHKGLIKRWNTIDKWRSQCMGPIFFAHPYAFLHSFILPSSYRNIIKSEFSLFLIFFFL
jgi:hypothetical protein